MTTSVAHREAQLERVFSHRVRAVGGKVIKLAPTERGVPDRLVLMPGGHMYLVELKAAHGTVSKIQKHWHEQAARLGTRVVVLYGHAGVVGWVAAATEVGLRGLSLVEAKERTVERRVWRAIRDLRDEDVLAGIKPDDKTEGSRYVDGFLRGIQEATIFLWRRAGVRLTDDMEPFPEGDS